MLRGGSDSEMMSGLQRDATRIIADAPGVARTAAGPPSSAELFVVVDLPKRSTGTDANVPLRGVQPAAFAVRKSFKIVTGRRFEPGRNEVIVGRGAAEQFAGLDLGRTLRWGENQWTVVGIFSRRRQPRRVGDLVRRPRPAAGLPARQHLPVGARPAAIRRRRSPLSRTP